MLEMFFWAVRKKFWNQGLATILLEEGIKWAKSQWRLAPLAISTKRNEVLSTLFKKMGFITEGLQERGARIMKDIFRCLSDGQIDRSIFKMIKKLLEWC